MSARRDKRWALFVVATRMWVSPAEFDALTRGQRSELVEAFTRATPGASRPVEEVESWQDL